MQITTASDRNFINILIYHCPVYKNSAIIKWIQISLRSCLSPDHLYRSVTKNIPSNIVYNFPITRRKNKSNSFLFVAGGTFFQKQKGGGEISRVRGRQLGGKSTRGAYPMLPWRRRAATMTTVWIQLIMLSVNSIIALIGISYCAASILSSRSHTGKITYTQTCICTHVH